MARILMTLLGLVCIALGIWLGFLWWAILLSILKALLIILLVLLGLALLVFGISEIAGAAKKPAGS